MSDHRILIPFCGACFDRGGAVYEECDHYKPRPYPKMCENKGGTNLCQHIEKHCFKLSDVQQLIRAARGCVTLLKNMDNPIEGSLDYRVLEEIVEVLKDE